MKTTSRFFVSGLFLLVVSISWNLYIHFSPASLRFYIRYVAVPLQRFKGMLLNSIPFSVGDIFYILVILLLLFLTSSFIVHLFAPKKAKQSLWQRGSQLVFSLSLLFSLFIISWGGNYNRPALSAQWNLPENQRITETELITLNQMLLVRLTRLSQENLYFPNPIVLNRQTDSVYKMEFGSDLPLLKIKSTLFGSLLNYLGASGYYNPFSGEGQFNRHLPEFMHPFVIAHEMAHQTGIAAEDDANLLAYIICIKSDEKAYQYAACFNLLTYSLPELGYFNPNLAKHLAHQLPERVKADWKRLRAYYRPYRGTAWDVSNSFYDNYLKWNGQKEGLESYGKMITWVYYWEFIKKERVDLNIYPFHK